MYEICKSLGDPVFLPCHYLHPASRIASPPHNSISSVIRLPCPQSTLSSDASLSERRKNLLVSETLTLGTFFLPHPRSSVSLSGQPHPSCLYLCNFFPHSSRFHRYPLISFPPRRLSLSSLSECGVSPATHKSCHLKSVNYNKPPLS